MAGRAIMGGAGPISAVLAALAVAIGLGWYIYSERQIVDDRRGADPQAVAVPAADQADGAQDQSAATQGQASVDDAGQSDGSATQDPTAETTDATPVRVAPGFDLVRVDADGGATVAGTAPAQADVVIEVDGVEITRARADGSGQFAALFEMPKSDAAQVIFLIAHAEGEDSLRSETSVIIAPRPEAMGVAGATEDPRTQSEDEPMTVAALAPRKDSTVSGQAGAAETAEDTAADPSTTETSETTPTQSDMEATEPGDAIQEAGDQTAPSLEGSEAAPEEPETTADATSETDVGPAQPVDGGDPARGQENAASDVAAAGTAQTAEAVNNASSGAPEGDSGQSDTVASSQGDDAPSTNDVTATTPELATDVPPKRAPAVLLADEDGVRLLQPSDRAPQVQDQVVIDVISYDESGEVLLEGRGGGAEGSERVQVYLNNAPVRSTAIGVDGTWRTPLPEVDTGIYTLRVDQVDAAGRVASRFETPFKREDPEVLASVATARAAATRADAPGGVAASVITVQPGYTLWGIASDRYGDGFSYVQIFEANKDQIRDPDLIYPGQVFDLPDN